jgi:hypothetical protein
MGAALVHLPRVFVMDVKSDIHPMVLVALAGASPIHRSVLEWQAPFGFPFCELLVTPLRVAFFQEGVDPFAGIVGIE